MAKLYISIILLCLCLLHSCTGNRYSGQLEHINALCDDMPHKAIELSDSISNLKLSEQDRHYLDLLYIKAQDKAYIKHISDSLILEVIEYYGKTSNKRHFAESLYYGGRVYSDLGDYPTALGYFQRALDEISEDSDAANLKSRILSQLSDILISLRLLEDARQYSKEALITDIGVQDSVSILYDYEQLGNIDLQAGQYETAEKYYKKAMHIANSLNKRYSISLNVPLATIKYYKGDIDSALAMIRPAIKDMDSISQNTTLACASLIYIEKNIKDTAILYAQKLIGSKDFFNRKVGYDVLLSDEIMPLLPEDSALQYIRNYRDEIESYLDRNGNQSALIQNSFYNYQNHLREKEKAEKASIRQRQRNVYLIIALVVILFVLISFIVISKYRVMKLRMALFTLAQLRLEITNNKSQYLGCENVQKVTDLKKERLLLDNYNKNSDYGLHKVGSIKSRISKELITLLDKAPNGIEIPVGVYDSSIYSRIRQDIADKKLIQENDVAWQKLEELICQCYPMYKMRLNNLGGRRLNKTELHILMMVKIGITPTDMSILLGRSKSTISYNRHSIAKKLFGEKMEIEKIDRLIRIM